MLPQLCTVIGIQLIKHSRIVNSVVVSITFSLLCYYGAVCYFALFYNLTTEQLKLHLMCHFFVLTIL